MQEIDWTPNELTSLQEHPRFVYKLLTNKDSFIRKKIIDQNLAYLNNRLTYYPDKLGLSIVLYSKRFVCRNYTTRTRFRL